MSQKGVSGVLTNTTKTAKVKYNARPPYNRHLPLTRYGIICQKHQKQCPRLHTNTIQSYTNSSTRITCLCHFIPCLCRIVVAKNALFGKLYHNVSIVAENHNNTRFDKRQNLLLIAKMYIRTIDKKHGIKYDVCM